MTRYRDLMWLSMIVILLMNLVFIDAEAAQWKATDSGTKNDLKAVWGSSGRDVFEVGI